MCIREDLSRFEGDDPKDLDPEEERPVADEIRDDPEVGIHWERNVSRGVGGSGRMSAAKLYVAVYPGGWWQKF